jgi:hypothetical protein
VLGFTFVVVWVFLACSLVPSDVVTLVLSIQSVVQFGQVCCAQPFAGVFKHVCPVDMRLERVLNMFLIVITCLLLPDAFHLKAIALQEWPTPNHLHNPRPAFGCV